MDTLLCCASSLFHHTYTTKQYPGLSKRPNLCYYRALCGQKISRASHTQMQTHIVAERPEFMINREIWINCHKYYTNNLINSNISVEQRTQSQVRQTQANGERVFSSFMEKYKYTICCCWGKFCSQILHYQIDRQSYIYRWSAAITRNRVTVCVGVYDVITWDWCAASCSNQRCICTHKHTHTHTSRGDHMPTHVCQDNNQLGCQWKRRE